MKNFVVNLRRIIGEEEANGFFTSVNTVTERGQQVLLKVPNFTQKHQEDIYPKIILRPFISFIPIAKGKDGARYFTTHEGRIQIDIFSKDEEQCIDITEAVNTRFVDFFNPEVIDFMDPYEWEDEDNIHINANYDTERNIIKFGDYTKVDNLDNCKSTPNSWFLDANGLHVNGAVEQKITEMLNGLLFPNNENIIDRGFIGIDDKTPMRELESDEPDTCKFTLEYNIIYNSYRTMKEGGEIDNINVNAPSRGE